MVQAGGAALAGRRRRDPTVTCTRRLDFAFFVRLEINLPWWNRGEDKEEVGGGDAGLLCETLQIADQLRQAEQGRMSDQAPWRPLSREGRQQGREHLGGGRERQLAAQQFADYQFIRVSDLSRPAA